MKDLTECKNPDCDKKFVMYSSLNPFCSPACRIAVKGKPKGINKKSAKRKKEDDVYEELRLGFLKENTVCVIHGTYCTKKATTIEHSAGRIGYYDQWARDNNIPLYIDVRFFKASCSNCNQELENNPELSRQHQLSKIHGGKKEAKGG